MAAPAVETVEPAVVAGTAVHLLEVRAGTMVEVVWRVATSLMVGGRAVGRAVATERLEGWKVRALVEVRVVRVVGMAATVNAAAAEMAAVETGRRKRQWRWRRWWRRRRCW